MMTVALLLLVLASVIVLAVALISIQWLGTSLSPAVSLVAHVLRLDECQLFAAFNLPDKLTSWLFCKYTSSVVVVHSSSRKTPSRSRALPTP